MVLPRYVDFLTLVSCNLPYFLDWHVRIDGRFLDAEHHCDLVNARVVAN